MGLKVRQVAAYYTTQKEIAKPMITVSGGTKYRNHYTKKKQRQQVMYHLLIQNNYKKHTTQNSILITLCLKVHMKANKIYKLKTIFLSQMEDITAFYKNQLMEVTQSIAKNQIKDIPRRQSSTNTEQPISNQIPLNRHMNQRKNQNYLLNYYQQFPTLSSTSNQTSYTTHSTSVTIQTESIQNPLITITSNQNV